MKNVLKNERGVTLVSLAAAIIILGIITSMLIYNVKDTKDIERVSNMNVDIEAIEDRVSNYYSRYGALPVINDVNLSTDATIQSWRTDSNGPLGANDTGDFYVIDMNALENLSLNYGRGFESARNGNLPEDKDVYVINGNSHNIFYLHGVKVSSGNGNNKIYYTNKEKDVEKVNIRYVAGVKIPDGLNYKSGNSKNNLIVTDNSNAEYIWANTEDEIYTMTKLGDNYKLKKSTELDSTIVLDTENGQNAEDMISSAKEFGGFYYKEGTQADTVNIIYFSVAEEDNWRVPYDKTATYTDKNGDKAYIPTGFKISRLSWLNTINKGLVIKNKDTGDEYVWIDVPDNVLANARTLEEIENALKEYTNDYREEGYEDEWYDGCGYLQKSDYYNLKNKMLQSIKENGGFYIGRYEAGISKNNPRTAGDPGENVDVIIGTEDDPDSGYGKPASQKDKYPYNYVTVAQAQGLSQSVKPTGADYETSLMFGLQWDLVCKFLEETGAKTYSEITKDSTTWGNYSSSPQFELNSGKYSTSNNYLHNSSWKDYTTSTEGYVENKIKLKQNEQQNGVMYTTGAAENNKIINIYDFAGNVSEMTLEKASVGDGPVTFRSGSFFFANEWCYASWRYGEKISYLIRPHGGFRVTLFQTPATTQQ